MSVLQNPLQCQCFNSEVVNSLPLGMEPKHNFKNIRLCSLWPKHLNPAL